MPTKAVRPEAVAEAAEALTRISEAEWSAATRVIGAQNDEEPEEESPIDRVVTVLSEVADPMKRSKIAMWQLREGEPPEWKYDYTVEQIESGGLPMIRKHFGAGTYELRVYGYKPGSTRFVVLTKPTIKIGADPLESSAVTNPSAPGSDVTAVLTMLAEGQRNMMAEITKRPDPMASMKDMLTMMTLMRGAMGLDNAAAPQKTPLAEVIDAIKEIKGVQQLLGGDGPEKTDTERLIEMAQPLVKSVLDHVSPAQQVQVRPAPQLTVPRQFGGSHAPTQMPIRAIPPTGNPMVASVANSPTIQPAQETRTDTQPVEISEDEAVKELQEFFKMLIDMAAKNDPVEKGIDVVYERLPEDMLKELSSERWWQMLMYYAPEVAPHEKWFTDVRDGVLKEIAEDNADEAHNAGLPDTP